MIMKHKVKIFSKAFSCTRLEEYMNEWFEEHENVAIVDIKYAISQSTSSGGSITYNYSALVHYMED